MLPKFASHVFHHTQRAAQAAAQNHALRNVLGLQNQGASASSTGPLSNWTNAASGSSWGGAGGAKYNTGSQFYRGYSGAGRTVTQANSTSAHDNSNGRTDDDDELPRPRSALVIRSRPRPRSSSLHLTGTGRQKRAETFGILQTVHLHQARAAHTLVKAADANGIDVKDERSDAVVSSRVLVRRNSTAASNASDIESLESSDATPRPVSPKQVYISSKDALSTDPSVPQSVLPPKGRDHEHRQRSEGIQFTGDNARVVSEVLKFRSSGRTATVHDYNSALYALVRTRQGGQPITLILETYNEMLTRQISPNVSTYKTMVFTLCERDREVERVCTQIEWRQNRRRISGRKAGNAYRADQKQLELLQKEDNFGSAMLVFEAAQNLFRDKNNQRLSLGPEVYSALLRSCMIHANTDAAVRIWGTLESIQGCVPDVTSYLHLLGTYAAANEVDSAQEVFDEFQLAAKENRISWPEVGSDESSTSLLADATRSGKARVAQMLMWVKLIEAYFRARQPIKALSLLEQMMDSSAPIAFGPTDVPLPCTSVYSAFVRGFIENDDLQSAVTWFDRMLEQDTIVKDPLMPSARTPRPDQTAWNTLIETFLERGMLTEASEKYKKLVDVAGVEGLSIRMYDRIGMFALNVTKLQDIDESEFDSKVKFITEYIIDKTYVDGADPSLLEYSPRTFSDFLSILSRRGWTDKAAELLQSFVDRNLAVLDRIEPGSEEVMLKSKGVRDLIGMVLPGMLFDLENPSSEYVSKLQAIISNASYVPNTEQSVFFMHLYRKIKMRGETSKLSPQAWRMFSSATARILSDESYILQKKPVWLDAIKSFLRDVVKSGYSLEDTLFQASPMLVHWFKKQFGEAEAHKIFKRLGPEWVAITQSKSIMPGEQVNVSSPTSLSNGQQTFIDKDHSRSVDEYFPANPRVSPKDAWSRYEAGAIANTFPTPDVLGRLIATFGRLGDVQKVHKLYNDSQRVLAAYENDKESQSVGWYAIEDQMIIALAHAGKVDMAHVHRQRIIDQGGNPSADAYGALIQCVRETTDDSANALALWHESQMRGVVANLYLYNTVISKLSRARKADYALELFKQMKTKFVRPSSVTYGAVIAACCRVGDAQSAEVLFEEMTAQKNFKPRVPPYNTMIQFYTHILRDRERALHYFGALIAAGISPTAHTYKLLIDCYGTIEPADVDSMEDVFLKLSTDTRVQVQGVHWAALINAWGCVQKDLGRAMSIFDSIATHPTTQRSRVALPDAIVYESMINVLVTLRRTDLISMYLDRLTASGVHMTAYIANLLIKGYATGGDIERARQVFESLQDPPVGHAAPNNHVPHSPGSQMSVSPDAAVYREPSTWEAMVRAELGNGDRTRASALLQRVQERHFPPAVYARISGIMLDDSVSPWSGLNFNMDSSTGSHSPQ